MILYNLVDGDPCSASSIEVAGPSEKLMSVNQTTRCHISVEHNRRVLFAVRTKAPN